MGDLREEAAADAAGVVAAAEEAVEVAAETKRLERNKATQPKR